MTYYTKTHSPPPSLARATGVPSQSSQQRIGRASSARFGSGRAVDPADSVPEANDTSDDPNQIQNLETSEEVSRERPKDSDASSITGAKAGALTGDSNFLRSLYPRFSFKKARDRTPDAGPQVDKESFSQKRAWSLPKVIQSVKAEELKETDTVIALMGPTGSGKSSFISTVADSDRGVGHGLVSYTSDVNVVRVQVPNEDIEIVLVDTPGFDDTHKSDYQILQVISKWLEQAGHKNVLLDGILYLHRISDNRMAGTPLRNLELFEKICGPQACNRIVMVTTMWDELDDDDTGNRRQGELESTFWKPMLDRGSSTARYRNTPESAWGILEPFLEAPRQRLAAIQLQKETVKQKKALPSTDAGQALYDKIEELDKKRKSLMRTLNKQINKRGTDEEIVAMLRQQYDGLEKEREAALVELQALKVPVPQRFFKSVGMKKRYRR